MNTSKSWNVASRNNNVKINDLNEFGIGGFEKQLFSLSSKIFVDYILLILFFILTPILEKILGLWSRYANFRLRLQLRDLIFLAPAATSRSFWLRIPFRTIWSKNSEETLYYLYNSLAPQTISVEPEPKIQTPAPPSKKC